VRTSKTVAGDTTEYVLDLLATLPVVISDTEAVYLYGLGIIAQQQSEKLYYVHDGLGSVRQLADSTGQIETNYAYDPFGVPVVEGNVYNPYQYTGEAWDSEVELLYLRARYYQAETGRFITKDPWAGDVGRPSTLNLYAYAANNPANHADPTGLDPAGSASLIPPGYDMGFQDDRDLTIWLWHELFTNANGPEAQELRRLLHSDRLSDRVWGTLKWIWLVKDRAKWDFKHRIGDEIGLAIMLRHTGHEYGWYDYQMPGNIHYAYVGRVVGWTGESLHWGAGFAQVIDPAHKEEAQCLIPPWDPLISIYVNVEWADTQFDQPLDWKAVEFGIMLFERYRNNVGLSQFRDFLGQYGEHMLTPPRVPVLVLGWTNPWGEWPYSVGYFDGPNPPL
jgi:RHS repeat-associated protein